MSTRKCIKFVLKEPITVGPVPRAWWYSIYELLNGEYLAIIHGQPSGDLALDERLIEQVLAKVQYVVCCHPGRVSKNYPKIMGDWLGVSYVYTLIGGRVLAVTNKVMRNRVPFGLIYGKE